MAVIRTVLPRKGLVQSQHGLTQYESDQDGNWLLLDSNVAFVNDLLGASLGINGVIGGFTLGTVSGLTPTLGAGALYAQGIKYAPALPPALGPAPASATSYLFYNSSSGFYYQASAVAATPGDALIGQVVAGATAVTAVTQATRIMEQVALAPTAAGNFTVPHLLGRAPIGVILQPTSAASIYFQATQYDAVNLYLAASAAGSGKALLW